MKDTGLAQVGQSGVSIGYTLAAEKIQAQIPANRVDFRILGCPMKKGILMVFAVVDLFCADAQIMIFEFCIFVRCI